MTGKGTIPTDHVHPDSLKGVTRLRTNASRFSGEGFGRFVEELKQAGVMVSELLSDRAVYVTDGGGIAHGMPHGVVRPSSPEDIAKVMRAAQNHLVPVTVRGGGLTTEGESIAYGGLLLDMSSMNRVISIDSDAMTVTTEAGIFWHHLAEELRRRGLDYHSAPLNLTSTVGGTLGVGGIDINSHRFGCSADQATALKVVTPTGEILKCSESENPELMDRVLLGYGQFGVVAEATLKVRPFHPIRMRYFYYSSLRAAVEDLRMVAEADAADYSGILTIMDRAVNLLIAFDSDEREREFDAKWKKRLSGHGEVGFLLHSALFYMLRPWRAREALYLAGRRLTLFPEFERSEFMRDGKIFDRATLFSRAVWKFWGGTKMVIPDLSAPSDKFAEAVQRGNAVCRKYFDRYTLYCVGIKLFNKPSRYEMSCIPPGAETIAYGCEFEPIFTGRDYSRDHIQRFKNEIYDIGPELGLSYYRFGGMMKGYIRRVFGDEVVDRHLEMKRQADPGFILNPEVIF